jgi:hypothetical protein
MKSIKIMIGMQTSDGFTVSWGQLGPFFLFLRRRTARVVVEQSENLVISDEPVVVALNSAMTKHAYEK